VRVQVPSATSHSFSVLSLLDVTAITPSGLNAQPVTLQLWPLSTRRVAPVVASMSRHSLLSWYPANTVRPSGLKQQQFTW
jgi:hypothetical protein